MQNPTAGGSGLHSSSARGRLTELFAHPSPQARKARACAPQRRTRRLRPSGLRNRGALGLTFVRGRSTQFNTTTYSTLLKTAPKRSSTKENVQIGFGNTFDCVVKSAYLATSEPCLATSNRSFKTRWLHLFLSSKYVRGQKRVSFDHLGLKPSLGAV